MLTQARRNPGRGADLIEITNFYVNFQENVSTKVNLFTIRFFCLENFQRCPDDKDAF